MLRFLSSLLDNPFARPNQPTVRHSRPRLEALEDRLVPSTATVDLTTVGSRGEINGAIFQQGTTQQAGSGAIHSFVRIHNQARVGQEQGYNTDARPVQYNENPNPTLTHSLRLSEIPVVSIGGVNYRVFFLVDQNGSRPLVSLDQLRIYEGDTGNLTGYDPTTHTLAGHTALYDLDAGGDHWVELSNRLTRGGSSTMVLYVPDSDFLAAATSSNPYVYVFSRFGDNIATRGGFEEWGERQMTGAAPASLSGFVTQSGAPAAGALMTLTGTDTHGNFLTVNALTDANGFYSFSGLAAGIYTISISPPTGFSDTATAGNLGGTPGFNEIGSISLGAGLNGVNYNFVENPNGSSSSGGFIGGS